MVSAPTRHALFAHSSNECAFEGCDRPLIDAASGSVVGEICHIRGQGELGPRHVPGLSARELHGQSNLILLCRDHHKVVDDGPDEFTIERLEAMKLAHEDRARLLSREVFLAVLADLAPPAVPDEWWSQPGAPTFWLHPATNKSTWVFQG